MPPTQRKSTAASAAVAAGVVTHPEGPVVQPTDEDITSRKGALQAVRPDEPVEPLDADADYVEYKGKATTRRITEAQWEKAGVKDQTDVVWDRGNEYRVSLDDLNEAALVVLRRDGAFAIPEKSEGE